jgi:hypothetical protein
MKTYDQFKEFYSKELFDELLALNGFRKNMLIKCALITVIFILLAGLFAVLFSIGMIKSIYITLSFGALCILFWYLSVLFLIKNFHAIFKRIIIEPLVKFIDPTLQYAPEGSIDLYTFRQANIFQYYTNEFDGEDLVCGTIDKTKIKFSQVYARYRDEDKGIGSIPTDDPWLFLLIIFLLPFFLVLRLFSNVFIVKLFINHDVFKGLFFVADFNKDFSGYVLVMPDKAEKYFGRFGSMLQSHNLIRGELVKMDNTEFEKHFAVYGTDQVQARYVLTPRIMEKILDFKKKTGAATCLSFKDSMLYIAVPYKQSKFTPPLFKSLADYVDTCRYFQDLTTFISIAEEFNLNTRIWTKE